jgi:hypothetical protein
MLAVEVSELHQEQPPESRSLFECLISRITGNLGTRTHLSGSAVNQEFSGLEVSSDSNRLHVDKI